ncbi:MAG: hypothetical protein NFCOHLIN_02073 [Gammaproteobacteria bacterium]|nr:hypothetical protein [Gammaproteobacteria bacterium]
MITRDFADEFSKQWIEAWNRHDLDRVLSHYTDDFEMSSPYIVKIAGEASGTLKGKPAIGAYWGSALERLPALRFELVESLIGIESITLYYRGARGIAAEVFFFNAQGKVFKACAHYA